MKKLFSRKKAKKSVTIKNDVMTDGHLVNGGNIISLNDDPNRLESAASNTSTIDDYHSCFDATTSSQTEEHHNDDELDKHMMQIISDIKYINKRPKYVAVGEVNFQRETLDAHNLVRTQYGCASLLWSQELSDLANSWAKKLAGLGRILFAELPGVGENIYLGMTDGQSHLPSGSEITEIWAKEADNFDFDVPKWRSNCQHFTQMVWKGTNEMGIARTWNITKNCVAIVAFYRPSGNSNAPGEFKMNVPSRVFFDELPNSSNPPQQFASSTAAEKSRLVSNKIRMNSTYK